MTKQFDVAIVGGGVGGLTLAIQMAERGYQTILFEKEKFPFNKVCGEYISNESFDFLVKLGLPLHTMDISYITNLLVSAPNGHYFTSELKMGGFGISRYTLDYTLFKVAKERGVVVREGEQVNSMEYINDHFTIYSSQNNYQAKVVCGSFGKQSVLYRTMKLFPKKTRSNYVGVKYHVQYNLPDDRIALHNFEGGYCGISKVDGDKFCLCYLVNADQLKRHEGDINKMEKEVLSKNIHLQQIFNNAQFINPTPEVISQITFDAKEPVSNHILMLGDSAGTIVPLCGNGMSMAMRASNELAQIIPDFLQRKINRQQMETKYRNKWNSLFRFRITIGKQLQRLFGKRMLTNAAISILKLNPWAVKKIISLTHGQKF